MRNLQLLLLIIHISLFSFHIILPFEKNNPNIDILENLFNNEVKYLLSIGTPSQYLKANIDFSQPSFYISIDEKNSNFKTEKSSTYIDKNKQIDTKYLPFNKGSLSEESFLFINNDKEILIKNFPFYSAYNQKNNKNFYTASIGLSKVIDQNNFIYYLKDKQLIKNEIFTINYFKHIINIKIGDINIGDYPHVYNKDFKKEKMITLKTEKNDIPSDWYVQFDKIKYDDITIAKNLNANFDINVLGIIGTTSIQKELNLKFFNEKIRKKHCAVKIFGNQRRFVYYYCNKSAEIENFKGFSIYNSKSDYEFFFTYEDLFIKVNDKYYFLIVYDNFNKQQFTLGEVFLKKYQMSFNLRDNSISFYDIYPRIKSNQFWKKLNVILIIILIVLFVCVIIRVSLRVISKRMKSKYLQEINEFFINLEDEPIRDNKITI